MRSELLETQVNSCWNKLLIGVFWCPIQHKCYVASRTMFQKIVVQLTRTSDGHKYYMCTHIMATPLITGSPTFQYVFIVDPVRQHAQPLNWWLLPTVHHEWSYIRCDIDGSNSHQQKLYVVTLSASPNTGFSRRTLSHTQNPTLSMATCKCNSDNK